MKMIEGSALSGPTRVLMLVLLVFTGLTVGLLPCSALAADPIPETEQFLDRLEDELGNVKTLHAIFKQEKHLRLFKQPVESEGCIYFKAPDAVRFEIVEPFQSILIVDQDRAAKYEGNEDGWQRVRMGNTQALTLVMQQIAAWMQGRFRDQSDIFEIAVRIAEESTVVLTPKRKRMRKFLSSVELVFSEQGKIHLESLTIREPSNDYTVLHMVKEDSGLELDPKLFDVSLDTPKEIIHVQETR